MEKTMRLSLTFLSLGILSSLANSSCGKWAKASPETVTTMPRPTYPTVSNDVFSLNSTKTQTSYKGTMVIFSKEATVEDTAELINASVDSRLRWAESKKFQDDTNYSLTYGDENAVAKNTLKLMKDGLQKFDVEALNKSPIDQASKLANADTLLERELSLLNLTPEQRSAFDASWGHYCEAKLIEFAAHPLLAQNTFRSKPNPAALCQQYYAANQMMTSADCEAESGDYLKCVWVDGVSKTRWFRSPDPTSTEAPRDLKRSKLLEMFNETNYEATKGVLGFTESAFATDAISKTLYLNKKGSMLDIAVNQRTAPATCAKAILNAGSKAYCSIFGEDKETFSPKQVIDAMEGVTAAAAIVSPLPAPLDRSYNIHQLLQYLNKRNLIETSESDRLFLDKITGSPLTIPAYEKFGGAFASLSAEIRSGLGADFYGKFSAADLQARALKLAAIEGQEARINFNNAEYIRYLEAASAGSERGAAAANRPGFSKGFIQYELVFQQLNNILNVELRFEDQNLYAYRTCLDLNSNQNVLCPEGFTLRAELTYLPAMIEWASDGGKIDLSFKLENVNAIGFGPRARKSAEEKPSFFMDLPAEETEGKTLRFELYRNRLLDSLDIMTGKAFIEDGANQLWEAGISIWENVQ